MSENNDSHRKSLRDRATRLMERYAPHLEPGPYDELLEDIIDELRLAVAEVVAEAGKEAARAWAEDADTKACLLRGELLQARVERDDALKLVANRDRLIDSANAEIERLRKPTNLFGLLEAVNAERDTLRDELAAISTRTS